MLFVHHKVIGRDQDVIQTDNVDVYHIHENVVHESFEKLREH